MDFGKKPASASVVLCVFIIAVFLGSFGFVLFATADDSSASLPARALGETWTFALDYKGDIGLKCDLECTVTADVTVSGKDCF